MFSRVACRISFSSILQVKAFDLLAFDRRGKTRRLFLCAGRVSGLLLGAANWLCAPAGCRYGTAISASATRKLVRLLRRCRTCNACPAFLCLLPHRLPNLAVWDVLQGGVRPCVRAHCRLVI